jgi:replicative DNA helicase
MAHHADIVLGLFREEQYSPSNDVDGAAEVHVLKSRDGSLGYADLFFYKRWLRFEDMVEP